MRQNGGRLGVEAALNALPKVQGGNGQLYMAQPLAKVFNTAEEANRDLYGRLAPIFANVPEEKLQELSAFETDVEAIKTALKAEGE